MNFIFFTRVNCKKLKMLPSTLTGFLFLTRTTSTSTETVEFGGTEPLRLPVDLHQPLSMISYHLCGKSENDNVTMDDNDDMCVDPYAREGPRRRSRFSSVQVPVTVRSRPSTWQCYIKIAIMLRSLLWTHQSLCIWFSKADLERGFVKEDLPSTVWLGHFSLDKIIIN